MAAQKQSPDSASPPRRAWSRALCDQPHGWPEEPDSGGDTFEGAERAVASGLHADACMAVSLSLGASHYMPRLHACRDQRLCVFHPYLSERASVSLPLFHELLHTSRAGCTLCGTSPHLLLHAGSQCSIGSQTSSSTSGGSAGSTRDAVACAYPSSHQGRRYIDRMLL